MDIIAVDLIGKSLKYLAFVWKKPVSSIIIMNIFISCNNFKDWKRNRTQDRHKAVTNQSKRHNFKGKKGLKSSTETYSLITVIK